MTTSYGKILDPHKKSKELFGLKAERQYVHIDITPSTIDQNQDLPVRIPNLGAFDLIVPNTTKLVFNLKLEADTDKKRSMVNNIARSLLTSIKITYEGNIIQDIQSSDVWFTYKDLWIPKKIRDGMIEEGIDDDGTITKLRLGVDGANGDHEQKAVATTYGTKFCIPLDFDTILNNIPYSQSGMGDRLSFVLHFASYSDVLKATSDTTAKYKISDIGLEFEKVTDEKLATIIKSKYIKRGIPYERILLHRTIPYRKKDTIWNIQVNVPSKSLKGIALMFIDPDTRKSWAHQNEKFYNPSIKNVSITIEGEPNKLYTHGMKPSNVFPVAKAYFDSYNISDVKLGDFLTSKYCLFLDFRSTPDNLLHGSGTRLENTSDGITLHIERNADAVDGRLLCYVFIVQDAQVNIENARYHSNLY